MVRRRRAATTPEVPDAEGAAAPDDKTAAASMQVTLRGDPEKVRKELEGGKDGKKPDVSGGKVNIHDALKDPNNVVVVKRLSPRKWKDQSITGEVYREACPLALVDIEQEIFGTAGGKQFQVRVVNPDGITVAAQTINTDVDPIIQKEDPDLILGPLEDEPDVVDMTEETLKKQVRMMGHQVTVAQLRSTLEDMKGPAKKTSGAPDPRIELLEASIKKIEEDGKLSSMERRHDAEMAEIRRELAESKKTPIPAPNGDNEVMKLLVKQMEADRTSNEKRFTDLLAQMKDDKLGEIQRQLTELKNKPNAEGSSMKDSIEMFTSIAGLLGMEVPGGKNDEDEEPKEWYEKLIDHLPDILEKLGSEKKEGGKEITKEDLTARIAQEADRAIAAEKARIAQAQAQAPPRPPIKHHVDSPPVNVKTAPPTAPPPAPSAYDTPTAPPAAPATPAPEAAPAPAPAPAPAEAEAKVPSIEKEIAVRCAQVLTVIAREMSLRPRDFKWSFLAWDNLPEGIRENMCRGSDSVTMFDAFSVSVNPKGIEELKAKVAGDEKLKAWLQRGHDELKRWQEKLDADPKFDPNQEEEPEEEEEPEKEEGFSGQEA